MQLLTYITMMIIGLLFMAAAFLTTGIGPALTFSREKRTLRPITRTGRVLVFLIGLLAFVSGVAQMMGLH